MRAHASTLAPVLVAAALLCAPRAEVAAQARRLESPFSVPQEESAPLGPGRAFAYSAVLPGTAQRKMGSDRWVAYVGLEALGWWWFLDRRGSGRALERRYRELAWDVARRVSVGPRRDGDFTYYEAVAQYDASGRFDSDPAAEGLQPESDETTYNGSVWALARAIYLPSEVGDLPPGAPEYRQALDYYRARAVGPEFAWAWGANRQEQAAYREMMRRSDEALRSATRTLGLILANHVVSAVDALVAARLSGSDGASPARLDTELAADESGHGWTVTLRYRWPRR